MHVTITPLTAAAAKALKPAINDPGIQLAVEKAVLTKASGTDEAWDRLVKKGRDLTFKGFGLDPATLAFFPQAEALIPSGQEIVFRKALVDLEHATTSRAGEDWFKAGLFLFGTPKTVASLCDPKTPTMEKLFAGGKLAAKCVGVISPFIPALQPYKGWAQTVGVCFEVGDFCYLAYTTLDAEQSAAKT